MSEGSWAVPTLQDTQPDLEEGRDEDLYRYEKDALMYVIQVTPSMLAKNEDGESNLLKVLKNALEMAKERILAHPSDLFGIMLFGHFSDSPRILFQLEVPDVDSIKRLKSLIEDKSSFQDLVAESKDDGDNIPTLSMRDIFIKLLDIFTSRAAKITSKRAFLITDDDDPHKGNVVLNRAAITTSQDLQDGGITLEPFFITSPQHEFDISKFYDFVTLASYQESTIEMGSSLYQLNDALSQIRKRLSPQRAIFSSFLEFGPKFRIGVRASLIYKEAKPSYAAWIYTKDERPKLAETKTVLVVKDTGRIVDKQDTVKAYRFGGELIDFTKDELAKLRNFGTTGIRILGFYSRQDIAPFQDNLKPSYFLYPSDLSLKGSTPPFAALLETMRKKDKVALAWIYVRSGTTPYFGALWPSLAAESNLHNPKAKSRPDGMYVIQLPYADDIRQFPPDIRLNTAPKDLRDKMRAIIKTLTMPRGYQPERYWNPALRWHNQILEAIALDEEMPKPSPDPTLPKYGSIQNRSGALIEQWQATIDEIAESQPQEEEERPRKKRTREDEEKGMIIEDERVQGLYEKDKLDLLSVAELRSWVKDKGIGPVAGLRKAHLIEKVKQHLS